MPVYRKFEETPVWIAAKDLAVRTYSITRGQEFGRGFGLKDQIRRAAVSVSSNIAEGLERGSKKELIQFLFIARGSLGDVRSLLAIANELDYISDGEARACSAECVGIASQLTAFIDSLKP